MNVSPKIEIFPADPVRGLIGLVGIVTMAAGAGFLWGFGGFCIAIGAVLTAACILDEALERITRTRRDHKDPDPQP